LLISRPALPRSASHRLAEAPLYARFEGGADIYAANERMLAKTRIDLLTVLPPELVYRILDYASLRDIVRLSQVRLRASIPSKISRPHQKTRQILSPLLLASLGQHQAPRARTPPATVADVLPPGGHHRTERMANITNFS